MTLIDKDALVAEIEKRMERAKFEAQQAQENNDYVSCVGWSEHFATCGDILRIIDTLEVKEVDLEKEYEEFVMNDPVYNKLVNGIVGKAIAKYFFELGMRASNPLSNADIKKLAEEIYSYPCPMWFAGDDKGYEEAEKKINSLREAFKLGFIKAQKGEKA